MGDDGVLPTKRSKFNLGSSSKPREEMPTLETISETTLVDLNEVCLNEMLAHLNVIELCYVSRVCKRLQQLAESYFKRRYCDFDFSKLLRGRLISNKEARGVLFTFGPTITSMSIQRHAFHNHGAVGHVEESILNNVAECCKQLNILTLTGFSFTSRAAEALNLLSDSLTALTLDGTVFADCVFHLINFSSLTSLILINFNSDCYPLMDTFPNLKYLKLYKVSIPNPIILHHFIVRHSQLKTLLIWNSIGVSSAVARLVAKYVKNLRQFHFFENSINPSESPEEIKKNFLQLSELRNLDYLALTCSNLSIGNILAKMVANKITLTRLFISKGFNDAETVDTIVQMKCLEELTFLSVNGLNGEHLIKCAKELTRLKELTFRLKRDITAVALKEVLCHTKQLVLLKIKKSNFQLDSGLYNDILYIVKERRNGTKLEINFRRAGALTGVQILVPQGTMQANENWLTIKKT